jgi:hypothetical protein
VVAEVNVRVGHNSGLCRQNRADLAEAHS